MITDQIAKQSNFNGLFPTPAIGVGGSLGTAFLSFFFFPMMLVGCTAESSSWDERLRWGKDARTLAETGIRCREDDTGSRFPVGSSQLRLDLDFLSREQR